jgi:hypothetical protein
MNLDIIHFIGIQKRALFFLIICICIVCSGCSGQNEAVLAQHGDTGNTASSYEDCVAQGNIMLRTLPPQCVTKNGKRFTKEDVVDNKFNELKMNQRMCEDLCGNNACEEIVCQGQGCPCAETALTCPKDCKK